MPRDSKVKMLGVAFVLCLVCSILVSAAAVGLKARQERNKETEKRRNILQIARMYDPSKTVDEQFSRVRSRMVDLEKGQFVDSAAAVKELHAIPAGEDSAGIRSRPRFMEVYLVEEQGRFMQVILPVYGKGLWSTMYGFIALGPDLSTVTGFGFYQHGETPGLGGEIDNPNWLAKWPGKLVYDQSGKLRIEVIKGTVDTAGPDVRHKIDGISGATLTARGVSNLLAYWLGENGYKNFLQTMRKTGGVQP